MINNPDRHLWLYAKGWYKRTDVINDLKIIIGERSGMDAKYVDERDIFIVLSELVWHVLQSKGQYNFSQFLSWCNRDGVFKACLSELSITDNSYFGELGDPDYSLLPSPKE